MREGLPTVRIRTYDQSGAVTGEAVLDPSAARTAGLNLDLALENLGTAIDPTGGVPHGGAARFGTEDGWLEIAWTVDGTFRE